MFSYLSTEVSTIYPRPHSAMAFAVFSGSLGSSGGGAFDVLTEQNLHPRVQVSPISMRVAVAVSPDRDFRFEPGWKSKSTLLTSIEFETTLVRFPGGITGYNSGDEVSEIRTYPQKKIFYLNIHHQVLWPCPI